MLPKNEVVHHRTRLASAEEGLTVLRLGGCSLLVTP
jgi:hypothetical protein